MAESKEPARRRPSITARVLVGTLVAVVSVLGLTTYYVNVNLARLFQREGNRELQEKAALVVERLEVEDWEEPEVPDPDEGVPPKPPQPPRLSRDLLEDTEHLLVRILDFQGRTLLESEGLARLLPQSAVPPLGTWTWKDVEGPKGAQFLVYAQAFDRGWVLAAWDIRHENRLLKKSRDLLYSALGAAALLAALVAVVLTRRGLAPVQYLADHAEGIRPGALHLDLDPGELPKELQPLAINLKGALARLDEAFARLTSLNADVAHELRTPLHGMRLEVEGLLRNGLTPEARSETLEGLLEALDHLGSTLDQMLFLARAEDPAMALEVGEHPAAGLLRAALGPFDSLAEEKDVTLEVQAPEDLRVRVDEKLARRALHNLLANALRHAPPGSTVTLRALGEGSSVILQVGDTGEGIPQAYLAKLGQRFLRPDLSRSRASGGAGLGLAIVSSILRLHGGALEIQSAPGQGTLARLRFPA